METEVPEGNGNPEGDKERSISPTTNQGQAGKGAAKKSQKKKERGRRNRDICDVFGESAMVNAYYICHNVQDFLNCRGFPWNPKK